jgi:predicted transporter
VVVIGSAVAVFIFAICSGQRIGFSEGNQIRKRSINSGESNLLTLLNQGLVELLGRYEANGLV